MEKRKNTFMRRAIIIALISFCTESSFGQISKDNSFENTVKQVILKLSNRDSVGISKFIDKRTGVYILYTVGTKTTYDHYSKIGFSDTSYPNSHFYNHAKYSPINYAKVPSFSCSTGKWSKKGLFVDTTKFDQALSKTAESRNKYFHDNISANVILKFKEIEAESRRIVVADDKGEGLIFFLSFIGGKWVLTIIDKATCDCGV